MKKNAESAENIERLNSEIINEGKNKEQNSLSKLKLSQELSTQTKTKEGLESSINATTKKLEEMQIQSDKLQNELKNLDKEAENVTNNKLTIFIH